MKKSSSFIIIGIGLLALVVEYFVCLNYDYSKFHPFNKVVIKSNDDFIGDYRFQNTERDRFDDPSVKKDFSVTLKSNQECSLNLYRYVYSIKSATQHKNADYCKYEYNSLNNEIIIEYDDEKNYNAREILKLSIKDSGLQYDGEILKQ